MQHWQEAEFDKVKPSNEKCPPHEVVKLYILGAHTDYGCLKCKLKSSDLSFFDKK